MSTPTLDELLGLNEFRGIPNSTNNSLGLNAPDTGLALSPPGSTEGINLAGLGSAAQSLAGLASAWAGLQGIDLGRDQLRFQRNLTNRNLANQARTTNAALADRQQRRLSASGGGQYQSVADYMRDHGVSGGAI